MLRLRNPLFLYFLITVYWVILIMAKFRFNGLIYGFDYGLYQPDGKFYTYMTLDAIHGNPYYSAQLVVEWYKTNGLKMNIFTIQDLIPDTSSAYSVISHRILYPLLSIPFVYLFGIPGMLVIPSVSLLVFFYCIQGIAQKLQIPIFGMIMVFIISNSSTFLRWMVVNTTDSLAAAIFALVPIIILYFGNKNLKFVIILGILIVLSSSTRFVLPYWLAIMAILYFREKNLTLLLYIFALSLISAIPALVDQVSTAILPGEKELTMLERLLHLPISFVRVIAIDIAQLAVLDRVLLSILIFAMYVTLRNLKEIPNLLCFFTLIAGYAIGAINGTLGVNFRYQLPALIFVIWSLLYWLSKHKNQYRSLFREFTS